MSLPDAELLAAQLADAIRPHVRPHSALVGIHSGGAWVAQKLHAHLGGKLALGSLDSSFYRDDFDRIGLHPAVQPSDIPFEVEGAHIILVDDVLYTGRTVRAAINELYDYGRPAAIALAVLVDRGGRELPIAANWVGAHLSVAQNQNLQVTLEDGKLSLSLHER